jgi:cephalosporin hydroxylase
VKITIDLEQSVLHVHEKGEVVKEYGLDTKEAFSYISEVWLRSGWDNKYVYGFSWLGRPIIQLPEDMIRIQEVIYRIKPDIIIETGVAHGGSLIYYSSICKAIGKGSVIGIDIEIRPHNRKAIEEHELFEYITLIEGSSTDSNVLEQVRAKVNPGYTVLVILDSNHTKQHVLEELRAYADFVSIDSYIVATDGIMEKVVGAPRTQEDWIWNNPKKAAEQFVSENEHFLMEEPVFPFNEGQITERVTYWPSSFIKRLK